MSLVAGLTAFLLAASADVPSPAATQLVVMQDTVPSMVQPVAQVPEAAPVALTRQPPVARDTTRGRTRARAVTYSDGYGTRLKIHKTLSWAMLPLFAVSYVSGDRMLSSYEGAKTPPEWAKTIHPVAATSTAVLFGANTVTGAWNLWEGRHDPNGRVKRFLHAGLFMAASGGFTYAGTKLANEAEESNANRRRHRNMALGSMGVATSSWLLMLLGN